MMIRFELNRLDVVLACSARVGAPSGSAPTFARISGVGCARPFVEHDAPPDPGGNSARGWVPGVIREVDKGCPLTGMGFPDTVEFNFNPRSSSVAGTMLWTSTA